MKSYAAKIILIVEDNPGDRIILTELLQASVLDIQEIIYADNLALAIELIKSKDIDIILLDLSLPDSTGLQTFITLQKYAAEKPVVILSGMADTDLAFQAIQEGAQDYLLKDDFDEKILAKTIGYSIERKRNLKELSKSNERFNLVSKATNDMVWDWNIATGEVFRNAEQFVRIMKLPAEAKDNSGDFWYSRMPAQDKSVILNELELIKKDNNRNNFDIIYKFLRGDDQYIYLNDRGYVVRDESGNPVRIIGASQDITDKINTQKELDKLSLIAKKTINSVIVTDTDGKIEWVNEAFTTVTEYGLQEVLGKKPGTFLQGEETDASLVKYMQNQITKCLPFTCEIVNYGKSGRKYWVEIEAQPIFDTTGNLTHYFALQMDITQRKFASQALKKSEEQYRYLFNNNPATIIIWYLDDFSIADFNDRVPEIYGYTRKEMLQMTVLDLRPKEDEPLIKLFAEEALLDSFNKITRVWRHTHKDGSDMFMQITSSKINYNGRPAILALQINITEKLQLEKKLEEERIKKDREITEAVIMAQEQEREEIGRELHDNINQILVSSRLYLGLLKANETNYHPYVLETDKLIKNAIEELRALSHALVPPLFEDQEFRESIDDIMEVATIGRGIKIEKEIDVSHLVDIPDKMRLVIYRIIQEQFHNIFKYANADKVWFKLVKSENQLLLVIKDNGDGYDSASKTAGLGLMNIKTRAALFNGKVTIQSSPGNGFKLEVRFNYQAQ